MQVQTYLRVNLIEQSDREGRVPRGAGGRRVYANKSKRQVESSFKCGAANGRAEILMSVYRACGHAASAVTVPHTHTRKYLVHVAYSALSL
jgi:hypothetical protein